MTNVGSPLARGCRADLEGLIGLADMQGRRDRRRKIDRHRRDAQPALRSGSPGKAISPRLAMRIFLNIRRLRSCPASSSRSPRRHGARAAAGQLAIGLVDHRSSRRATGRWLICLHPALDVFVAVDLQERAGIVIGVMGGKPAVTRAQVAMFGDRVYSAPARYSLSARWPGRATSIWRFTSMAYRSMAYFTFIGA